MSPTYTTAACPQAPSLAHASPGQGRQRNSGLRRWCMRQAAGQVPQRPQRAWQRCAHMCGPQQHLKAMQACRLLRLMTSSLAAHPNSQCARQAALHSVAGPAAAGRLVARPPAQLVGRRSARRAQRKRRGLPAAWRRWVGPLPACCHSSRATRQAAGALRLERMRRVCQTPRRSPLRRLRRQSAGRAGEAL